MARFSSHRFGSHSYYTSLGEKIVTAISVLSFALISIGLVFAFKAVG